DGMAGAKTKEKLAKATKYNEAETKKQMYKTPQKQQGQSQTNQNNQGNKNNSKLIRTLKINSSHKSNNSQKKQKLQPLMCHKGFHKMTSNKWLMQFMGKQEGSHI